MSVNPSLNIDDLVRHLSVFVLENYFQKLFLSNRVTGTSSTQYTGYPESLSYLASAISFLNKDYYFYMHLLLFYDMILAQAEQLLTISVKI